MQHKTSDLSAEGLFHRPVHWGSGRGLCQLRHMLLPLVSRASNCGCRGAQPWKTRLLGQRARNTPHA
eukprot:706062-Amphidinium_carterae.2